MYRVRGYVSGRVFFGSVSLTRIKEMNLPRGGGTPHQNTNRRDSDTKQKSLQKEAFFNNN
jgi:hypothetical protein